MLTEITRVFLRFGILGFGGPIAAMAMMEEELVRRRKWLTSEDFAGLYATCKVLPGAVSTQMAIGLGYRRGGTWGGILAGTGFILPGFLLVLGLSVAYESMASSKPFWFEPLFSGLQAGALGVIFASTFSLAKPYRKKLSAWGIALASAGVIGWAPRLEPWVIFAFGLTGAWSSGVPGEVHRPRLAWPTLIALTWVCFKAGAFVFGSGLAIVPLLEAEVVQHHAWVTHREFMDGLALGQVTPGPIIITTTFIGYRAAGYLGAILATMAVFLPGFINMLIIVPRIWKRIGPSPRLQGFVAWAIPAVIGGIVASSLRLSWQSLDSWPKQAVLGLSSIAIMKFRAPAWAVIPGAGALTVLLSLLLGSPA